MTNNKCLLIALLWLCAFVAAAAGPGAVRKQIESSMLVTGSIDIEQDGSVAGHRLDEPGKIPAGVVGLIDKALPTWRFEPVLIGGKTVKARARMSLRVVARKLDDGDYRVDIRSAGFGEEKQSQTESVASVAMPPPKYPPDAFRAGISGDVYLIVRVNRQGLVEDLVAEQVNLKVVGSEQQMQRGRELLTQASMKAARNWTFKPPTAGDAAGEPYWSVRVPVAFRLDKQRNAAYGEWEAYVPGPRHVAPWIREDARQSSPDAMLAGGIYPVGSGPKLLTPLGQG